MNPIRTLHEAITLPFTAIGVIALCAAINWMTAPAYWWVQWVVLGMGIAVISAWWRALKLLLAGGALALIGGWAYQRWGDAGRRRIEGWLQSPPPAP